MKADLLLRGIAQLVTPIGPGPKCGLEMRRLKIEENAAIAVSEGTILWAGSEADWTGDAEKVIDLDHRAVVPALVDPHTHAVWAGDRLGDFDARSSGKDYESILAAGGGIWSTIRATAAVSEDALVLLTKPRIDALMRSGATVIEVKSGYGFSLTGEIAMLKAIRALSRVTPARLVPTLLIHVPPANATERADYVAEVCQTLIPLAREEKLAEAVDIFVEKEAWTIREAERILVAALRHGLAIKMHTEQFHRTGGVELGVRMKARSVDHLEACNPQQVQMLAKSSTIATVLPGVSLHLGLPAAPGRKLIDAGAAVAVGTDLNPGSSPLYSTGTALALAVRLNGLTAAEALVAGTVNAACALGRADAGRIEAGLQADFLVLCGSDWRELVYTLGANPVDEVWIRGERVVG